MHEPALWRRDGAAHRSRRRRHRRCRWSHCRRTRRRRHRCRSGHCAGAARGGAFPGNPAAQPRRYAFDEGCLTRIALFALDRTYRMRWKQQHAQYALRPQRGRTQPRLQVRKSQTLGHAACAHPNQLPRISVESPSSPSCRLRPSQGRTGRRSAGRPRAHRPRLAARRIRPPHSPHPLSACLSSCSTGWRSGSLAGQGTGGAGPEQWPRGTWHLSRKLANPSPRSLAAPFQPPNRATKGSRLQVFLLKAKGGLVWGATIHVLFS